jgi:membrane carboxypeptidase/penicillin-binding protein
MNRPDRHPEKAWKRRAIVLGQMARHGVITVEERDAALAESMEDAASAWEHARAEAREATRWRPNRFLAPYFVRHAQGVIERNEWSHGQELREEGLEVVLTVDMRLQTSAEDVLREALDAFDERKRKALVRTGDEDAFVPVSGALVCLDNRPSYEGFVRALVGDRDFLTQQYCKATQATRQPGSTVKAYIWAAALDNGFTPSDTELDTPFVRIGWEPKNYGGRFTNGPVTLRNGLERSVNMVAIRVLEDLGVPLVQSYMQRLGLTTDMDSGLALALGTCQVRVIDQCAAYAAFANGGLYTPPTFVREIRNRDRFTRYNAAPKQERVLPENVAYVLTNVLRGVCEHGTAAKGTRTLERPRAGKTGTTNDYRDAWFCGYTPDYTCVVWVGYADNRPLGRGGAFAGGSLTAPIWTAFMRKAHEGRPVKDFLVPTGVDFYDVDKASGLPGGTFREAFVKGTRPPVDEWRDGENGPTGRIGRSEEELIALLVQ